MPAADLEAARAGTAEPAGAAETGKVEACAEAGAEAGAEARLHVDSPVGPLVLTERNGRLVRLSWGTRAEGRTTPLLQRAAQQLADYFSGDRKIFDLPLAPDGTAFQRRVYAAMSEIPCGRTRSYGEIAADLGSVARAVGGACGSNPIPIVIPCHRVLASGGRLGGFSGGPSRDRALDTKRWLLRHEGALQDAQPALL
jgi:methylated-DNA-[protein]-cysteine S-methyltransferase